MPNESVLSNRIRRKRRERGQVILEFAIAGTAFFLFVFGIFDFARAFESWVTVQHASREAARYAITGQTTCAALGGTQTRGACIVTTAKSSTTGMLNGGTAGSGVTASCTSTGYAAGTWTGTVTGPTSDCTGASTGSQCDAVEVTVSYTHQFISPIIKALKPSGMLLIGRQRMINEPFGPC